MERSRDIDHWRKLAADARAAAEAMTSPVAKRQLFTVAEAYQRLAEHAERTVGRQARRSRE
jgi:hypothetical protein